MIDNCELFHFPDVATLPFLYSPSNVGLLVSPESNCSAAPLCSHKATQTLLTWLLYPVSDLGNGE